MIRYSRSWRRIRKCFTPHHRWHSDCWCVPTLVFSILHGSHGSHILVYWCAYVLRKIFWTPSRARKRSIRLIFPREVFWSCQSCAPAGNHLGVSSRHIRFLYTWKFRRTTTRAHIKGVAYIEWRRCREVSAWPFEMITESELQVGALRIYELAVNILTASFSLNSGILCVVSTSHFRRHVILFVAVAAPRASSVEEQE